MTQPACAANPDLWFATLPHLMHEAARICQTCPLLDACAAYIAEHPTPHGVWAGKLPSQRPTPDHIREPAPCGTTSGYARHRRDGEGPCQACRAAHSAYHRRYDRQHPDRRKA